MRARSWTFRGAALRDTFETRQGGPTLPCAAGARPIAAIVAARFPGIQRGEGEDFRHPLDPIAGRRAWQVVAIRPGPGSTSRGRGGLLGRTRLEHGRPPGAASSEIPNVQMLGHWFRRFRHPGRGVIAEPERFHHSRCWTTAPGGIDGGRRARFLPFDCLRPVLVDTAMEGRLRKRGLGRRWPPPKPNYVAPHRKTWKPFGGKDSFARRPGRHGWRWGTGYRMSGPAGRTSSPADSVGRWAGAHGVNDEAFPARRQAGPWRSGRREFRRGTRTPGHSPAIEETPPPPPDPALIRFWACPLTSAISVRAKA